MRGLFFIGLFLIAALSFGQTGQSYYRDTGGDFICSEVIRPSITVLATDNWNPTGLADACRVTVNVTGAGGTKSLTGIEAQTDGKIIFLVNVGDDALIMQNNSASSLAANRFLLDSNRTLTANQGILIIYDGLLQKWLDYNL